MDREKLIEEIKDQMRQNIDRLDWDNFQEVGENLSKYLQFIDLAYDLPLVSQAREEGVILSQDLQEVRDDIKGIYEGRASLKLSGAELGSFGIFIPEKLVRRLDIQEGDWVGARKMDNRIVNGFQKPIYEYRLIKKAQGQSLSKKRMIRFARVEFDEDLQEAYILSSEAEEAPVKILLTNQKPGNLTVREGDVVDYAYWEENILAGRVVWKHNIFFDVARTCKQEEGFKAFEFIEDFLEKTKIGLIGETRLSQDYQEWIQKYGGDPSYIKPQSVAQEMEEALEDVDLAIFFLDHLRPAELERAKLAAENLGVEAIYAKDMDAKSLMYWICNRLQLREYRWM